MTNIVENSYQDLTSVAQETGLSSADTTAELLTCIDNSLDFLAGLASKDLESRVPGKNYLSFQRVNGGRTRTSRGVNTALFNTDIEKVVNTLSQLANGTLPTDALNLQSALYTAAISYPAAIDVLKDGDKKSPGTFLERLVGNLVGRTFEVEPTTTVKAPTLDLEVQLPTDLIFDLGPGRSRIHLPVKASTRERVIQVWAHQRVLDGMHGVNRFRGLLVVLAETNRQSATNSITEVCLPDQWTAYQMYIAQLHRVYYFDVPERYRRLRDRYPFLEVKAFADFFRESEAIALPREERVDLIDSSGPAAGLAGLPKD